RGRARTTCAAAARCPARARSRRRGAAAGRAAGASPTTTTVCARRERARRRSRLPSGRSMANQPGPRIVDGGAIRELIDEAANPLVLRYLSLHQPSCHSDSGELLLRSAGACGDCTAFSPSFAHCRFVALITNRIVFALGLGQRTLCYRL